MNNKLLTVLAMLVNADFKTVEKKFLTLNPDAEEVKKYLKTFKQLRDQNRITDKSKKDIEYWGKKNFSQFKEFVDALTASKSKSKMKKLVHKEAMKIDGADLVAENDDWLVYRINTYSACKLLGSRNWCIVRDEDYWNDYTDISYQRVEDTLNNFYFVLAKNRPEDEWHKIAIQVESNAEITVWDALDKSHDDFDSITLMLNLPKFEIRFPDKCTCGHHSDNCTCCPVCDGDSEYCNCCYECNNIREDCTCCPICHEPEGCDCCYECNNTIDNCRCCSICGGNTNYCDCCHDCENTVDNCTCCPDCGETENNCSCEKEEDGD